MQIKLFTIPVGDNGSATQDMNAFLRGNKILEVENKLISNEHGAYWCFCVRYIERSYADTGGQKGTGVKVDYRKVLDEATFQKFSKLREIRKKVAAEEAISAFIIFYGRRAFGIGEAGRDNREKHDEHQRHRREKGGALRQALRHKT